MRQEDWTQYGILTYYDLITGEWVKPVLVGVCRLAPTSSIMMDAFSCFMPPQAVSISAFSKIDTDNLAQSKVVLQADMKGSCFYPFV